MRGDLVVRHLQVFECLLLKLRYIEGELSAGTGSNGCVNQIEQSLSSIVDCRFNCDWCNLSDHLLDVSCIL